MKTSSSRPLFASISACLLSVTTLIACGTKEDALVAQNETEKLPVSPVVPPKPEKPQPPVAVIDPKEVEDFLNFLSSKTYQLNLYFNTPQGPTHMLIGKPYGIGVYHAISIVKNNAHLIYMATLAIDKSLCGGNTDKPLLIPIYKNIASSVRGTYNIPVLIQNCKPAQDAAWDKAVPNQTSN